MTFISFIIATYNCKSRVPILLQTVKSLQHLDIEFLVSDGGSNDGTFEELEKIDGINIICSKPDKGIYDAWNRALGYAKGNYISFIGVDDIPNSEFIKNAELVISENANPAIIYGNSMMLHNSKMRMVESPLEPKLFYNDHPVFDIPHQGLLHSANLFVDARFNEHYKLAGDIDFLLSKRKEIVQQGIKKISCIQAHINADGVSMSAKGHIIYYYEYKRIEKIRNIKLGYSKTRFILIGILSYVPAVYNFFRFISWNLSNDNQKRLNYNEYKK